jgi:hypothetical protein
LQLYAWHSSVAVMLGWERGACCLGALGVQGTRSKRRDRAVLGSAWSWGRVRSLSGGSGELVGEVGRPGVLSTPRASSGARRPTLATRGMEGEVGFEGHCQMGSWEVTGARLVAGWVLGVVERGCRVWSANLAWIASVSSKIFQANETKGLG